MIESKKEQLERAELALWRIFGIVSDLTLSRPNKHLAEVRQIIREYLNDKLKIKEEKEGEKEK